MITKDIIEMLTIRKYQEYFNSEIFNTAISDKLVDKYPYEKVKYIEIYKLLSGILKTSFTRMDIKFSTFGKDKTSDITDIYITSLSWNYEIQIPSLKFQYMGDSRKECLKKYKEQFIEFFTKNK